MLLMVAFFFGIKDSPSVKSMLTAVRPVVVGLLIWTAYDMALTVLGARGAAWGPALLKGWDKALIALTAFFLLVFTQVNPVILIAAAALLGFFVYR
jgi:chromate transport protein ChrA